MRTTRLGHRLALRFLAVALLLTGCSSPRPNAPYRAQVRDATLETLLRTDIDDAAVHAMAADQIRRTQEVLAISVGEPSPSRSTVWLLGQTNLGRFLRRVGRSENTGAATVLSRGAPEVYTHRPSPTATREGDATQRLHARFVLSHEYTHAWLNTRSNAEIEEGFANWVAIRSLRGLADEGVILQGVERMATTFPRINARVGDPVTVDDLLRARGESAYVHGTALFLWFDEERRDDRAFRAIADATMSAFGAPAASLVEAALRETTSSMSLDARFAAWLEAADARRRSWWMSLAFAAVGSAADGAAILADDEPVVVVSFADPTALPEQAAALDAIHGRPPLDRVEEVELTIRTDGGTFGLEPTTGREPGDLGLELVRSSGRWPAADGDRFRLRCEGSTIRLLRGEHELFRWPDAACQLFAIGGRQLQEGSADAAVLPVIEVRCLRRMAPAAD